MKPEELKALLDYHDNLYYNQDAPEISDIEYDVLKAQYLELTGEDEYTYVPGSALFNKITHTSPILSLDKVKITEEDKLRNELTRLFGKVGGVIEPKFDGLTIVKYPDGKCVTRGDGSIGEDVSANCKNIKGLQFESNYPVRLEALMPKSVFNNINQKRIKDGLEPFKNPRNAAAGMLRNKDASKVEGLMAYAYDLIGYDLQHTMALTSMENDKDVIATPNWFFKDVEEAIEFIKSFDRDDLDYEIDGLVVKSNYAHSLEKFGITGHHPKNAIAIKFVAEEKWTELDAIRWEVGRTGKVVPVAHFAPIELMGSTVSKATLHNIAYIKALGLDYYISDMTSEQTKVKITKANDIIPAVIAVEQPKFESCYICNIHAPKLCPDCGQELEQVKDQVYCRNESCKERLIAGATHMVTRAGLDIAGLSEETIRKMYDALENPSEYGYTFPLTFHEPEYILHLEGFAVKSATKLANAINHALEEVPMTRFLTACGIPLLGKSTAKLIAKKFKSLDELADDIMTGGNKLNLINGIGKELIASIDANWDKIVKLNMFVSKVKSEYEEPKTIKTDQKTFVVTGSFDKPRSYFTNLIEEAGHKASSSISKKTFCVLVGEEAGPKKLDKIAELGIKTITTEEELKELL